MIVAILVTAALIVSLGLARKARPAGNRHGTALENQQYADREFDNPRLKVATFNVQTGKSLQGRRDITRAAQVVANTDIVGIQEVYAPSLLNMIGIGVSQTEVLAMSNRFAWLFCATRRRWLREHRGNALLSKLLIEDWRIASLPDRSGKSYRNMTVARTQWRTVPFYIINTHLHTREGREEQLEIVLREFAKYSHVILMGDFNSQADTPALINALKDIEVSDAIKLAGLASDKNRIDWILTKGFNVHDGTFLDKGVSDHPFYSVTLSIKEDSE